MTDFIAEFAKALLSAGFTAKDAIQPDDKWHPAFYNGEKKATGAYSLKICSDDFAVGCFFTRKDPDNKINWHSKSKSKVTPEEAKKMREKIKYEQRTREAKERKRQERLSIRLTKIFKHLPQATTHPYLKNKQIKAFGLKIREKGNELILPLYGSDSKIGSVQRINAKGVKLLFTGGRKQGCYFPICTSKDDLSTMLVAEGFATGASIKLATDLPVIVAFDSGNLKPVCIALKAKYPATRFIICADNDIFTKNPKGEPWNVGIEAAEKAAEAIGGALVIAPNFDKVHEIIYKDKKPTDFNDLFCLVGKDEVKNQILQAIPQIPAKQEEAARVVESPPKSSKQHDSSGDFTNGDFKMNFRVLGYNEGQYFYYPNQEKQIVAFSATAHSQVANLLRLDSYDAWRNTFATGDDKISDTKMATYSANALMQSCKLKGVFKSEDRVRGAGVWIDGEDVILHCGDSLLINNQKADFMEVNSEYTYVASIKLLNPSKNSLSSKEAYRLREICEKITWENKLSGSLLAGWVVIAPICGALNFRPHIYINGEADSGKSTVVDKIVKPAIGKIALEADGGTTEPKLRQIMGYDARPIIYDEAERTPSFEAVLALARAATNGKTIGKFGQRITRARYCFCFSAVNPPVEKAADESRMVFMTIKKNTKPDAIEEYNKLLNMIDEVITPDFANRLLARTLDNIDNLFKNIEVFKKATRNIVKKARASEVLGTIFAGLYSLSKTDLVTLEVAEKWVSEHDWSSYIMQDSESDPIRLLEYISSSILRVNYNGHTKEISIGDLINVATSEPAADKCLRYHGIAVKDFTVYFAGRNQHLAKILKDTDWSIKWTRMLANIPDSKPFPYFYFSRGYRTSGVSLPLSHFNDETLYAPEHQQPEFHLQKEEFYEEIAL